MRKIDVNLPGTEQIVAAEEVEGSPEDYFSCISYVICILREDQLDLIAEAVVRKLKDS